MNEKAPARATHRGGGTTSNRQGSLWHTQDPSLKHLSPGASRIARLIVSHAELGLLASVEDLARASKSSTRTVRLWLRELDAPRRHAAVDTPTPRTPAASSPSIAPPTGDWSATTRFPGSPRAVP